jgi:hypothetical protein
VHLRLKDSARTRGNSVNWGWWVDLDSTCGALGAMLRLDDSHIDRTLLDQKFKHKKRSDRGDQVMGLVSQRTPTHH